MKTLIGTVKVTPEERAEVADLVEYHKHLLRRFGATAEDERRLLGEIVYAYRRGRQSGWQDARREMGLTDNEPSTPQRELNFPSNHE